MLCESISYAAINPSENTRTASASGGVFPALARHILQQGGVVFGAAWAEDFSVRHIGIEKEADLPKLQSAKYSQSHLGKTYEEAAAWCRQGRPVLFSGTPCQVAGLKRYLNQDYDCLMCVDTICHGVPLEKAWKAYLKTRVEKEGKGMLPISVNMRSKNPAWAQYSIAFTYLDGTETLSLNRTDLFMKGFIGDYFLRESCYRCENKGAQRASDITLGDFWGVWDTHPDMDDQKGTSAVIIHTEKGQSIWQAVSPQLRALPVPLEDITAHNPSYLRPAPVNEKRTQVLAALEEMPFDQVMLGVLPKEKVVRFKQLRKMFGKCKHFLQR